MIVLILLMAAVSQTGNAIACKVYSAILHFCLLTVFALEIVASIHLYVLLVDIFTDGEKITRRAFLIVISKNINYLLSMLSFQKLERGKFH